MATRPRPYGVGAYSAGPYERYKGTFGIQHPCAPGVWAPLGGCDTGAWLPPPGCETGVWMKPGATPNLPRGFGVGPFGTAGFGA